MATEPESWARTARLILYHSQSTSARTLFLRHATGSVIAPEPLPFLSRVLDETGQDTGPLRVFLHPASVALDYCTKRGLPASLLQADGNFLELVETPDETFPVYLARFTPIDPPRELFDEQAGKFCAITELRGAHPAEMSLLQRAYQAIMG
jgi:hypothetical protein